MYSAYGHHWIATLSIPGIWLITLSQYWQDMAAIDQGQLKCHMASQVDAHGHARSLWDALDQPLPWPDWVFTRGYPGSPRG